MKEEEGEDLGTTTRKTSSENAATSFQRVTQANDEE